MSHQTIKDSKSKMTLFGSLPFEIIPRIASTKQITQRYTSIQLEKLENEWSSNAKRSSFLPSNFDRDEKAAAAADQQRNTSVTFQPRYFHDGEQEPLKVRKFCTGSRYIGQSNQLGMAGKGVYKYPHGVLYDGYFNKNGEFHGTGTLIYPRGEKIDGIWRNGKLVKATTLSSTPDNYQPRSQYCKMPDRRFKIEMESEVMPAGQEHLTNAQIPRKIPFGMYDTGNGYYNPKTRIIYDYHDPGKRKTVHEAHEEERSIIYKMILEKTFSGETLKKQMLRRAIPSATVVQMVPAEEYENWIKKNCRKAWDEPTGYLTAFYEAWTSGYKKDDQAITDKLIEISTAQQELAILQQVKEFLKHINQPNYGSRRESTMFSFIVNNDQQFYHKYASGKSSLQSTGRTSTRSTRSTRSYSHHFPRKSRKFDSPLLHGSPRSKSAPSSPSGGLKRPVRSIGRLREYLPNKQQYKKVQN